MGDTFYSVSYTVGHSLGMVLYISSSHCLVFSRNALGRCLQSHLPTALFPRVRPIHFHYRVPGCMQGKVWCQTFLRHPYCQEQCTTGFPLKLRSPFCKSKRFGSKLPCAQALLRIPWMIPFTQYIHSGVLSWDGALHLIFPLS